MKTQIEVITGFLGSGKTTFINEILKGYDTQKERIVVLQMEDGEIDIALADVENKNVYVKKQAGDTVLQAEYVGSIIKKYLPHRIIIEHNGMESLEELLSTIEGRFLRKDCEIVRIVHMVDASSFELLMNNMGSIFVDQISNSDLIVMNNTHVLSKDRVKNITRTLKSLNKACAIIDSQEEESFKLTVNDSTGAVESAGPFSKPSEKLLAGFFMLIMAYMAFILYQSGGFGLSDIDFSGIETFNTIFLSILIQAFPFILVGVLISSIIQVFVSSEDIVRLFPRNKALGFLTAIVAGVFFPVCDCGIVPIASRLAKKGVPLSVAVTFMLSAPIVNPIVIASTFYAFAGQPEIAIGRVVLGLIIAVTVGIFVGMFPEEGSVFLANGDYARCNCGFCAQDTRKNKGVLDKFHAVVKHAEMEFFQVGSFLILGAFLSTLTQTVVSNEILGIFAKGNVLPLIIMMGAAFVLSICSTSDAFIARNFSTQFAMGPVMAFMVLGAMLDIKNLLLLLGSFKKRFVVKLVGIIVAISFALLYFFGSFL